MLNRDRTLSVWLPFLLGVASLVLGWLLPKIEDGLPRWVAGTAFIIAATLIVFAMTLGFIATRRVGGSQEPIADYTGQGVEQAPTYGNGIALSDALRRIYEETKAVDFAFPDVLSTTPDTRTHYHWELLRNLISTGHVQLYGVHPPASAIEVIPADAVRRCELSLGAGIFSSELRFRGVSQYRFLVLNEAGLTKAIKQIKAEVRIATRPNL